MNSASQNDIQPEPVFAAARTGDAKRLRAILRQDPDAAFARDEEGFAPIHIAAIAGHWPNEGHEKCLRALVHSGVDVNLAAPHPSYGDSSALLLAAADSHRHSPIVELLVKKLRANANLRSEKGASPLDVAASQGFQETCEVLLRAGAPLTPHAAAALGRYQELKAMLRQDPDVANQRDPYLRASPLYYAAWQDQKEIVQLLLEFDVNLGMENTDGNTAMHVAAAAGARRTLELLISSGADVNARNFNMQTPLHWAIEEWYVENVEVVRLLASHGADLRARDFYKISPMAKAKATGKNHLVELLRKLGARE